MLKPKYSHTRHSSVSDDRKSKLVTSFADKILNLQRLSTSDVSDFSEIQRQVQKWKKEKYNNRNAKNDILILEKQIVRGQGLERPEGKPKRNNRRTLDDLTIALKYEHKNKGEGAHILKLPKLPYGQHTSYNEDSSFVQTHFIFDPVVPEEKVKEITDLTRKLRIYEKRNKGKSIAPSLSPAKLSQLSNYDKHEMKAGVLICQKEHEVIKSYEQEKSKFIIGKKDICQTFRELDPLATGYEQKLIKRQKKMSEDVKRRLYAHMTPEVPSKASGLLSKFGSLFNDTFDKQNFTSFNSYNVG